MLTKFNLPELKLEIYTHIRVGLIEFSPLSGGGRRDQFLSVVSHSYH